MLLCSQPHLGGGSNQTFLLMSETMEIPIPRAGSSQPKPSHGSAGLAEELNPNQLRGICRVFPESGCEPEGANGPGKIPGNAGAVPQDDAKRTTRGCSGRVLDLTWKCLGEREFSFCSCLSQGKMTRCARFSVRVESLPVFLLEAGQEDPGHWQTRVGRCCTSASPDN